MILERTIEVRVRVQCDTCSRNGTVRRSIPADTQNAPDAVRSLMQEMEEKTLADTITNQPWLMLRRKNLCPHCYELVLKREAVGA